MPGFETWDEIRIAYHVARAGTVSGAAEALGVHHATVIRHVDALEARLGLRLFQRHARGYTPTEAGIELMQVAGATDDQFAQLAARLGGGGTAMEGELTITSIPELAPLLVPALIRFGAAHPALAVRLLTDTRVYRLEYGEAHVAIRASDRPQEPDNVVQPFGRIRYALYAAPEYVAAHGRPDGAEELARHRCVGPDRPDTPVPFLRWLAGHVPASALVFRGSDLATLERAVLDGAGVGFLPPWKAQGMVEILPAREEWDAVLWLVSHVDLHRSAKVQAALGHLKAAAEAWALD